MLVGSRQLFFYTIKTVHVRVSVCMCIYTLANYSLMNAIRIPLSL